MALYFLSCPQNACDLTCLCSTNTLLQFVKQIMWKVLDCQTHLFCLNIRPSPHHVVQKQHKSLATTNVGTCCWELWGLCWLLGLSLLAIGMETQSVFWGHESCSASVAVCLTFRLSCSDFCACWCWPLKYVCLCLYSFFRSLAMLLSILCPNTTYSTNPFRWMCF